MEAVHDAQRLKELQALPLERKIRITQARILEWYKHYDGKVYVAFSGGKDSTVLLDLARRVAPDIPAAFVNTGLEYPEVRDFALSKENVVEILPRWGKEAPKHGMKQGERMLFRDIVTVFGYPLVSKEVSGTIYEARTNTSGQRAKKLEGTLLDPNGNKSKYCCERYKPMLYLPFRISSDCCKYSKKRPSHVYGHESGRYAIVGTMAEESELRRQSWIKGGCNAFDGKNPRSAPLSFWTEQDVLEYIRRYKLPIAPIYGEVVEQDPDGWNYSSTLIDTGCKLRCSGARRTGCMFCAYGLHHDDKNESRFQMLKRIYPSVYSHCMDGGQWIANPKYDVASTAPWNPKYIWTPSDKGLGMRLVFDMVNDIYGKDFFRYE